MKMKMKSITLSEKEIEKVSQRSEKYGITFSDMVRRIIDNYFEVEENDQIGKNRELEKKRS